DGPAKPEHARQLILAYLVGDAFGAEAEQLGDLGDGNGRGQRLRVLCVLHRNAPTDGGSLRTTMALRGRRAESGRSGRKGSGTSLAGGVWECGLALQAYPQALDLCSGPVGGPRAPVSAAFQCAPSLGGRRAWGAVVGLPEALPAVPTTLGPTTDVW